MPSKEIYGAQPPIELLRQFVDAQGFYDRSKLFWKDIEDAVLCAACGPPGGGRQEISQRFTRHFSLFAIPPPSENSMEMIYESILSGFFQMNGFDKSINELCTPIVQSSIEAYKRYLC